jgi:hypothetical protein
MTDKSWGPYGWRILHSMSYHLKYGDDDLYEKYPLEKLKAFLYKFLLSFGYLLPCDKCSKNFLTVLDNVFIDHDENNKIDIINFILNIHNGKSNEIWSREQLDEVYYPNKTLKEFNYQNITWIKIVYDNLPRVFDETIREVLYNFFTLLFMFFPSYIVRNELYEFTKKYNIVSYLASRIALYSYFIVLYGQILKKHKTQDEMYILEYILYPKRKKTEKGKMYFKSNIEEYLVDKKLIGNKINLYLTYREDNIYKTVCLKENIENDCEVIISPIKFLYKH